MVENKNLAKIARLLIFHLIRCVFKNKQSEVTPFGGIHLVHQGLKSTGVFQLIKDGLGSRNSRTTYSYTDLLLSRCYTAICGGECAEDVNYLGDTLGRLKGLSVPSPDRILAMEKELSTDVDTCFSKNGGKNEINVNDKMNNVLLKIACHLNVIDSSRQDYCLDFDHQFLPCEKYDAAYGYKKQRGYFPGVATIAGIPVYVENRNGNSQVGFRQLETLKRVFEGLDNNAIAVKHSRMDSGSYIKQVTDFLTPRCKFYIRADQCNSLLFEAAISGEWKKCSINFKEYELCSIAYKFGDHTHRMVCYRCENKNKQTNIMTGDSKTYMFIITNDRERNEKQIIEFYNQRGAAERVFDIQNNDFNWKKMPSSDMSSNTVYLIIMAICHVFYRWLICFFSKIVDHLKPHHRLKKFRFRLICTVAKITKSGRRKIVTLFTGNKIKLEKMPP